MQLKDLQMKRALRSVLIVLLLCVAGMTKAYAVTIGDLNYNLNSSTLTATVTGHKDGTAATENLIIPSSVTYGGQTYSVTEIGYAAFDGCSGFTGSLTIPNSVTSIGVLAFFNCSGFTGSLTIGNSVTTIGYYAFQGCSGFTGSLTIPNSVTSIGDLAFSNCSGFTGSLTIGNSVTEIGYAAFNGCSGFIGSLTIPNSITSIGSSTFYGCSGFTGSLTIGNSVTTIGNYAFQGCSGFTGSLTIPNSVTSIGDLAFSNCSGFTGSLAIGNSVTEIGYAAFYGCSGFIGSLTIPNSITSIGSYTFSGCSGFTGSLTIGNSVTTIGNYAFRGCSGFTGNLTLPNSLDTICEYAFYGCSGFTGSLTIPNSVTTIGNSAFYNCSGFTGSLIIGNSVTTIGRGAFCVCSGFTGSLTIPNSVTTIGLGAFIGCSGLTGSLTIPNSVTEIGWQAFDCCRFTGSLIIPNSITRIEGLTFNTCWNFTSVEIPETVSFIGERAFACWYGLQSMTVLADNPPVLEDYAFANVNRSVPVYVPTGSIPAYQAAPGWSEFTNYHEYVPTSYTITATANPAEGGSVTGGGTYTQGTTCTLTATANEGYNFVNWTENGDVVSTNANYSFTVSEDRNLVAHFDSDGNHWTPNGSAYSEIMAMYSVIQIDGVEQYSNTLEVGVFCGDECRGSAIASEFNLTHRYLAVLNVFGENGHQLTFKLFDHSTGQELNLTSPATVTFDVNGYGNPIEPYVLNFTSTVTHIQPLASGWNWWSTYIEQEGIDGLAILENSLGQSGDVIKSQYDFVENSGGQWTGLLSAIENEQGYKIHVTEDGSSYLAGIMALPENHPITLSPGWNWIGYPLTVQQTAGSALANFQATNNDVVKGQSGFAMYRTNRWLPATFVLNPGELYLYFSNASSDMGLVYADSREGVMVEAVECRWKNDFHAYANNLTIVATVTVDGEEQKEEDIELGAFVNGECRGSAKLYYVESLDRYIAFLTVTGQDDEEVEFKLMNPVRDVTFMSEDRITFRSDAIVGHLDQPFTIHFGTMNGLSEMNTNMRIYPNPIDRNVSFTLAVPEDEVVVDILITNALGEVVRHDAGSLSATMTAGLPVTGVYLVKVTCKSGNVYQGRIVVK